MPDSDRQREESLGFLAGISESVKAHIDERLRSPFAGAFVIAWLIVNWKVIFSLFLSTDSVVVRLEEASNKFDAVSVFWKPLGLSILITIGFYVFSALFLCLFEFYGVAKRLIERNFDNVRWVSPATYLQQKQKRIRVEAELRSLALDNLTMLNDEKEKVVELQKTFIEVQGTLSERTSALQSSAAELAVLSNKLDILNMQVAEQSKETSTLRRYLTMLGNAANDLNAKLLQCGSKYGVAGISANGNDLPADTVAVTQLLLELIKRFHELVPEVAPDSSTARVFVPERLLAATIDSANLYAYTRIVYPGLNVDEALQNNVIAVLSRTYELSKDFTAISDIHNALQRVEQAIETYRNVKPSAFTTGTDYIAKGLGFASSTFRDNFSFSTETKAAFVQFGDLV